LDKRVLRILASLVRTAPIDEAGNCLFCGVRTDFGHEDDCPVKEARKILEENQIWV